MCCVCVWSIIYNFFICACVKLYDKNKNEGKRENEEKNTDQTPEKINYI